MEQQFDLTNNNSANKALDYIKKFSWIVSPIGWLVWNSFPSDENIQNQVDLAIKLIKAGKENGLKKLKIKISVLLI